MENKFIQTFSTEEFINKICVLIKEQAEVNICDKGYFTFVLSGGKTPKSVFEKLASDYIKCIDWSKVHFFWVDERCVSADHSESNFKLAHDILISKLGEISSIHRIQGEIDPEEAAIEYEREIVDFFKLDSGVLPKFDFMLLGMGEDGHVASIFPGSRELDIKNKIVLNTENKYNGQFRISLGINTINNSRYNLLMINNEYKKNLLVSKECLPISCITNVILVTSESK